MRVKFNFDYRVGPVTEAQLDRLEKILGERPKAEGVKAEGKEGMYRLSSGYPSYEGDLEAVAAVVGYKGIQLEGHGDVNAFLDLADAVKEMGARLGRLEVPFNERVTVAVPGFALMEIRTVEVMVDACTDQVQRMLEEGWRILAICPQPDQRRPDYVMGRSDEP